MSKTTAQIASECQFVLDLETRWALACQEGTPEGDLKAEALESEILAWWDDLASDVPQKAEAALYVLARAEGEVAAHRAAKKALMAPLDARIRRATQAVDRIKRHILPTLIEVERQRTGERDVAIETALGRVRMQRAGSPALIGPSDPSEWPEQFTERRALTSEAKRYYKQHPEEMAEAGFKWDMSETIRIYR